MAGGLHLIGSLLGIAAQTKAFLISARSSANRPERTFPRPRFWPGNCDTRRARD